MGDPATATGSLEVCRDLHDGASYRLELIRNALDYREVADPAPMLIKEQG